MKVEQEVQAKPIKILISFKIWCPLYNHYVVLLAIESEFSAWKIAASKLKQNGQKLPLKSERLTNVGDFKLKRLRERCKGVGLRQIFNSIKIMARYFASKQHCGIFNAKTRSQLVCMLTKVA